MAYDSPQKRRGGGVPNSWASKANGTLEGLGGGFLHKRRLLADGTEITFRLRGDGHPLATRKDGNGECCSVWFTEKDYRLRQYGERLDPIYLRSGANYILMPCVYCKPIVSLITEEGVDVAFAEKD
ncbi:MAG: hypothetical protein LBU11_13285 [Zoogloeaceae bacterium]|jgi:hypothetical protein|nr:hypothetical protein [Zoogloeaceae bacterium]